MDPLARLGTLLSDRYRIDREVGQGGMATVYLAEDLKHRRNVALKVLKPELAAVLGTERFLTEINVTANLQHSHLLPLFDSGEVEGLLYYVMPYIAGETLRARLEREQQLPVAEAVRIAAAVASALDYAHRQGVVHRDLKPENILLHDGQPLVSDFGIALAVSNAGGARVTQTGLSLGTPQYMSPEQATGDRVIDARSDIYSLGAILYEMLTGDPPHLGGTTQAIIAKVLTERPPSVRAFRDSVPEDIDRAIQCALSKLPADRFATAGEFADAITGKRALPAPQATPKPRHSLLPWGVAAAAALFAGAGAYARTHSPTKPSTVFAVTFQDSVAPYHTFGSTIAISPDGSQLAFLGTGPAGKGLYLRRLDEFNARLLFASTELHSISFSRDGRWVLLAHSRKLQKISVDGGPMVPVADSSASGGYWADNGTILYGRGGDVWRVSEDGSNHELFASPDSGHTITGASALPGGKDALVSIWERKGVLADARIGIVHKGKIRDLGIRGTGPLYVNGYLIYARVDGALLAAPFSLRRRKVTGPAVLVLNNVLVKPGGGVEMALAANGTLIYKTDRSRAEPSSQLVRVDLEGNEHVLLTDSSHTLEFPAADPSGRRIAVSRVTGEGTDIWLFDMRDRILSELTSDGVNEKAEWTRDGRQVAFMSYSSLATKGADLSKRSVRIQPWDGSGPVSVFMPSHFIAMSFGPAHGYNAFEKDEDIWIAPVDSPAKARAMLTHPVASEYSPRVSPDGSILAYASDEAGPTNQVFIRPLPGPGARVQVSTLGGDEPVWSRDGKTLFYRSGTALMAAAIVTTPALDVARRDSLPGPTYMRLGPHVHRSNYDVLPDGQGFIFVKPLSRGQRPDTLQLHGITEWSSNLAERVRAASRRR